MNDEMKLMMMEDKEIWVKIDGLEGYEISTKGKIRSFWRCNGDGGGWYIVENPVKCLSPSISDGYYKIRLHDSINERRGNYSVSRLLAIAFIPNPDNLECVDHIDGNRLNNALWNLRWCTKQQNSLNRKRREKTTSGVEGVVFANDGRKLPWRAFWRADGSNRTKGFATCEEAIAYRRQMIEQHYDKEFYNER